jgi:hypothetical protein
MVPVGFLLWDKVLEQQANHQFPSSAEVNSELKRTFDPLVSLPSVTEKTLNIRPTTVFCLDTKLYLFTLQIVCHATSTQLFITFYQIQLRYSTTKWSSAGH